MIRMGALTICLTLSQSNNFFLKSFFFSQPTNSTHELFLFLLAIPSAGSAKVPSAANFHPISCLLNQQQEQAARGSIPAKSVCLPSRRLSLFSPPSLPHFWQFCTGAVPRPMPRYRPAPSILPIPSNASLWLAPLAHSVLLLTIAHTTHSHSHTHTHTYLSAIPFTTTSATTSFRLLISL